jgi:F-type H+-transporting ATPase subunit delta
VEEVAQVYARALFEVASERDMLDTVKEQLAQFVDALSEDHNLAVFFYSPYFSTEEKKQGLSQTVQGADETLMNFLETLVERHRMPEIFHIRTRYEEMWDAERKLLPVEVTSAVELDEATIRSIGDRISQQTGNKIELTTVVDPDVLGGIILRVGNFVLDASIQSRLNDLRKQVAQARIPMPAKEPLNANADQA